MPRLSAVARTALGSVQWRSSSRDYPTINSDGFWAERDSRQAQELLKELLPKATRVGVLMTLGTAYQGQLIEKAAGTAIAVLPVTVKTADEFERALSHFAQNRVDALFLTRTGLFLSERTSIMTRAARHRIPVIGYRSEQAEAGALMTYGDLLADQYRRSAHHADKILRGTKPGDIPIEFPTTFELTINRRTAKMLGLEIPQFIVARADKLIEP